jgi:hypothetical protein
MLWCRWIYRTKFTYEGVGEHHKARLVSKGSSQQEDINYSKTFSLVVKMNLLGCFMIMCILLNVGEFRPRVRLDLTNKNPKALTYQSSTRQKKVSPKMQ